jgi:HTH-type transcriptional regulator, sugar sensing transcriptional regulator
MQDKLRKLGLSPYESKCYLTLVRFGNLLGKEIAKKSNVPPTSVYRNLETLQKKGFVQLIQKEPLVYQAVDPEIAIQTHIINQKEQLDILEKNTISELKSIKKTGVIEKKEEVLEVYAGRKQSYNLGKKLIQQSKKEFLIIGRGTKKSILDLIHPLKSAVKKGVNCKFIITTYEKNKELVEELKKAGVKIKHLPLTGFSLLVKDRTESQVVIKDKNLKEERVVLRIKSKDLSQAHATYFDSMWKKATPL